MRIEKELKLDFHNVLIRPKRSGLKSRKDVTLTRSYTFKHSKGVWSGVPIIAANMDGTGTIEMASALHKYNALAALHKHYDIETEKKLVETAEFQIVLSSGCSDDDVLKLEERRKWINDKVWICLDVANGYSENFVHFVRKVRGMFPNNTIIAGNVVTGEMAEELILSGADIVKIGIGPGSVCTTRKKAGVGYPQLSAIIECADAVHGLGGHVIADGGCTCPGDIAKAFGAGADFVMLGGMLAGHSEGGGEIVEKHGKKYVEFYGMSSKKAMEKHSGGVAEYRASEGKVVCVPYKGDVEHTMNDILGGLRSCCTYVGASSLKQVSKRTTFIIVSQQTNEIYQE